MTEERFDEILDELREVRAPSEEVAAARERVWRQIVHSTSLACAELRPEFGAYRAGELTAARRLLIDDHLGRCAECRRILDGSDSEQKVLTMVQPRRTVKMAGWMRYAAAAAVAAAALYLGRDTIDSAFAPSGPRASVVSVAGVLQRLQGNGIQPGASLSEMEVVRTGAGSRAVLQLADGSRVELNQRTELALQAAWSGQTIVLHHGDVIVQAAKQRRGHLRVVTNDTTASVKGTIFAVSSGTAGSLVSVVEGSVAVTQPGTNKLLTAGTQSATNAALSRVPVRQAIAWSQDAEKYFALLAEFVGIEKQLAALPQAALRTEAKLLRYLPAGAVVYAAIPNLDGTLREAMRLVEQRARENTVLNEWWTSEHGQDLREALDRLQAVTPLLGDEVVLMFLKSTADPQQYNPVLLAQVQPDRVDRLKAAMDRLTAELPEKFPYQISQGLLVIADTPMDLAQFSAQMGTGASSPFASEITRRYQNGVGWLLGLDAASFQHLAQDQNVSMIGAQNVRYVFFEQRFMNGQDENSATVAFQGARTGIASWLATPGAAASAEYVSSEAVFALSVSTRDPRQALEELFSSVTGMSTDLQRFESETGVKLTTEIAGSLGTDFTFAIERPSLPIPGWLAAIEVVQPAVLDDAIRRLVESFNRELSAEDAAKKVTLTQEVVNGRAWMVLMSPEAPAALYWTHHNGFLIASTDRALAARAITTRASSASLVRSLKFQQRFPSTGAVHHSGFVWLNTNGVLADLSALVQSPALKSLMDNRDPLLIVLDGEMERIRAASRSRLSSLVLDALLLKGAEDAVRPKGSPHTVEKKLKSVL
ncbi:MAG TPA: FecR domain-containing protein [Bryobacteraceae bacterium]|nr:FecR domain-containing protein [Bryobacteraceae bacterium]